MPGNQVKKLYPEKGIPKGNSGSQELGGGPVGGHVPQLNTGCEVQTEFEGVPPFTLKLKLERKLKLKFNMDLPH